MNQLDLVWPGLVVVLSVAGAIIVRFVAAHGERAARERHRRAIERAVRAGEVWHERHAARDAASDRADTSGDVREAHESRAEARDRGDDG